jgi:hypothetical protein
VLNKVSWNLITPRQEPLTSWWTFARKRILKQRRKLFDSLVVLVVWFLWLERNNRVFIRMPTPADRFIDDIWSSCDQWMRAKLIDRSLLFLRD